MKRVDVRKAWLDETAMTTTKYLSKLHNKSKVGNPMTEAEKDFATVSGAYLYLLNLCNEHGLFDEDDPYKLFKNETLH